MLMQVLWNVKVGVKLCQQEEGRKIVSFVFVVAMSVQIFGT
jgi:hypothetical protein